MERDKGERVACGGLTRGTLLFFGFLRGMIACDQLLVMRRRRFLFPYFGVVVGPSLHSPPRTI